MKRVVALGSFVALSLAFAACGGSLASIPDEADSGTSSTGTSSPPSPPTTSTTIPTTVPSPGIPDGSPPPRDGSVPPSPSVDGSVAVISCGTASCNAASQECCVTQGGAACIAKGDDCQGGTLSCSGKASCAGASVCCAQFNGSTGGASCQPSCAPGTIQLCGTNAECTAPATCQAVFGGFKTCRRF